jgi:APA family basic amino acid/polyamine antiporter
MSQNEFSPGLGLFGAVSIVVGYVIGGAIFVLIGPLAFKTGPALWLTYALASIPALFVCFTTAQLGSALPVTGGNYMLTSRTMGSFWGFMTAWSFMLTTLIGVPLLAYGFVDCLSLFIPGLPPMTTAIGITLVLGLTNILGIRMTGWIQNTMVILFMAALLIFGLGGLFHINPEYITPYLPNGFGPVIMSAVPAYFSFVGFIVIVELGGEIKKPEKNIPLALLFGYIIILVTYLLVCFSLTAVASWQSLENTKGALAVVSQSFLPPWAVIIVKFGALLAMLTSMNAVLATSPKEVYVLARDKIFPSWLAVTNRSFKTPHMSIVAVTVLVIIGILLGAKIEEYAFISVMGVMLIHIIVAIGVLRLQKRLPEQYQKAPFKLEGFWAYFWPVGVIIIALIYILLGFTEAPHAVGFFFIAIAMGAFVYLQRRYRLKKEGIDISHIVI